MCVPNLKVLAMGKYNVNIITNIYIFKKTITPIRKQSNEEIDLAFNKTKLEINSNELSCLSAHYW
jgi:hypothetical protein